VRIGDDGARPVSAHDPRKLGRSQQRALDVHVALDERWHERQPVEVDRLAAAV
jgi:hypothetical protein